MDYKKLYEDALERARKIHDEIVNNEVIGFPEQITDIFPELRESEEERIRKEIKDIVLSYRSNCVYDGNHHFDECLAWLEKQKKQVTDESDKIAAAYQLGRSDERKQKEQKECHSDEVLNRTYQEGFEDGFKAGRKVERQNSSDNDFIKPRMQEPWNNEKQKEQKPHRVAVDTCEAIDKVREFDEQMEKEQKPVEIHNPTDEEVESWKNELTEFKKFATKQAKENQLHISYTRDVMWENFCSELLSFVNSRKPAEWSEEDSNVIETLIKELRTNAQFEFAIKKTGLDYVQTLTTLDKCPRLKQEWSEDDNNGLVCLRSLALNFMHYLNANLPEGKMCLSNGECADIEKAFIEHDWGKIIRYANKYKPHWKPSEEQMDVLNKMTLGSFLGSGQYDILRSLYNDLKKLKEDEK